MSIDSTSGLAARDPRETSLPERSFRGQPCRGLPRGGRLPRRVAFRQMVERARWTVRDYAIEARDAVGFGSEAERMARVFASDMALALAAERKERRLVLPVHEIDLVVSALRHFAGRRARRARAVALACLFAAVAALAARDGNANGRADVLDIVAAAQEIAGFGQSAPEVARRLVAPAKIRRG